MNSSRRFFCSSVSGTCSAMVLPSSTIARVSFSAIRRSPPTAQGQYHTNKNPADSRRGFRLEPEAGSLHLDALLLEVLERTRMPRQRARRGFLVLELEVLRFLVHGDQILLVLEDRLHDVVGGLVTQVLVRDEDVHDGRLLVVRGHAGISRLRDRVLDVQ